MSETKVFPMSTFMSYLKGVDKEGQKKGVVELVGYMADTVVDEELAPFAGAIAKAWIYEQHPEVIAMSPAQLEAAGKNVSVPKLPAKTMAEINNLFQQLANYKTASVTQAEELLQVKAELAAKTATLIDVEAKLKAAEASVKRFEASAQQESEKLLVAPVAKVTEYIGKVEELLKLIEDVKKHGVVTVASGGAPGAGGAPAAAPEPVVDFGVEDTFTKSDW
jgi:coenzyme F420-reducing hydrogenase alpha subunit